jgi:hypothetical protein
MIIALSYLDWLSPEKVVLNIGLSASVNKKIHLILRTLSNRYALADEF